MTQLKLGAALDYLWQSSYNGSAALGIPNTLSPNEGDDIWVVGLYGTYQATDKLSFNVRGEWGRDDGNSIPASASTTGTTTPTDVVSLYPGGGPFQEVTLTVQYNLWANVMTRGEFRWDHVTHGNWFGAGNQDPTTGLDTGGPSRNDDFLLALNIIYQF
jgi:hypothetical protein